MSKTVVGDLVNGDQGVKIYKIILEKMYETPEIVDSANFGLFPDWDLKVNTKPREVKTDFRFADTGNAAIEKIGNKGQPSGIYVTKAEIWVHLLPAIWLPYGARSLKNVIEAVHKGAFLEMPVDRLRPFLEESKFKERPSKEGAISFIVPLEALTKPEWVKKTMVKDIVTLEELKVRLHEPNPNN